MYFFIFYFYLFIYFFYSLPILHLSTGKIRLLLFQLYVVSVLWSDQNDIVIYRTLRDFKKMHVSDFFPPSLLVVRTTSRFCFLQ